MIFSINTKFKKMMSLLLVLVMMTTLFAGCFKDEEPEDTSEPGLNLELNQPTVPTETEAETEPSETTTAPVINENTATVTSQMNIRSSPSTEATIVGNLYAGDKVEISRRETVVGIDWAYIISPTSGWIVMEFVEMDIPTVEVPQENTSTPAGDGEVTAPTQSANTNTQNIKGVINANGLNIRSEASKDGNIQGAYNKGDVVTILETKNGWGRTNKGWISMDYVTTTGSSTTNNNTTANNNTSNVSGNGSTTVQLRGVVKVNELNIRASASTDADRVGMYNYGDRVEVLEKSGNWGRTKKGWIHLDYVYQDGTTGKNTISNATITGSGLNIRQGPGTGYDVVGSYNNGDKVTILEQFTYGNTTWGCTSKGWISMQYVNNGTSNNGGNTNTTTDNNTTNATGKTGTVFASGLNVRAGAGTGYGVVGSLDKGDKVTILEQTTVNGVVWGKISNGWISLDYIALD